jgi:hypothetical protein
MEKETFQKKPIQTFKIEPKEPNSLIESVPDISLENFSNEIYIKTECSDLNEKQDSTSNRYLIYKKVYQSGVI